MDNRRIESNGRRWRRGVTPLVLIAATFGALVAPSVASAAGSTPTNDTGAGRSGVGASDGSTAAPLPMTTKVLPNGVVVKEADPAALKALNVNANDAGCGRICDAKDPASYVWQGPGGPSNWYPCGNDAVTVKEAYAPGGGPLQVELRYSPRCRTAWGRSMGYNLKTDSFKTDGTWRAYTFAPNDSNGESHYTAMVDDAGLLAQACVGIWYGNGGGMDWFNCTTKY